MDVVVLAHVRWFTDGDPGYDWAFATLSLSLLVAFAAIVVAVAWRLAARRLPRPELPWLTLLGRLGPWIPRLLAVHAGVSLLAQASRSEYLVPALDLPSNWWGIGLGILEGIVGVWLIAGWKVRPAALLVVVAGLLGMLGYGVLPIVERADLLGIALFLVVLPPDDDRPAGRVVVDPERVRTALFGMRLLVGLAVIVLAYTEKLARPQLALDFLERYPAFNILHALGLDVSDVVFVQVAGGVEIAVGLLLISGAMPQLAVLAAGIPFNATLFFLGATELIGHLPIYGAMLALLVYGSRRDTAPVCAWVPRFDGRMLTTPARASGRTGSGRSVHD